MTEAERRIRCSRNGNAICRNGRIVRSVWKARALWAVGCPWEMREDLEYILVSTQYDDLKKVSDEIVSELQNARMRQTSTLPLKTALPL